MCTAGCVSIFYAVLSLEGAVCAVLTTFPSAESLWWGWGMGGVRGVRRVSLLKAHGDRRCPGGSCPLTTSRVGVYLCVLQQTRGSDVRSEFADFESEP